MTSFLGLLEGKMEQRGAETGSTACRVFTFKDAKAPQESLSVCIPEVLDPQYGMYVWPCAVVLAQYLWFYRDQLRGKAVLELGAGVSLPGVVAARCGAEVILSDGSDKPMCLENCRRSCEANGLQDVTVLGLSWGDVSPDLLLLPKQDIVLGSDVFYDPEDFEDVLVTFVCLLRKNPKAQFWTTYQVRRFQSIYVDGKTVKLSRPAACAGGKRPPLSCHHKHKNVGFLNLNMDLRPLVRWTQVKLFRNKHSSSDWSIEALLHRWKLDCVTVPLADFDADQPELAGSTLPGNHSIQMMILTRRTEAE